MNTSTQQLACSSDINEPPDIRTMQINDKNQFNPSTSFLQALISNKHQTITSHIQQCSNHTFDLEDESLSTNQDEDIFIPITTEDKCRLYLSWQYSVIIKVFGRKITLHTKLLALWNPTEDLPLIDLGSDFFLIKFQNEENMFKALHEAP